MRKAESRNPAGSKNSPHKEDGPILAHTELQRIGDFTRRQPERRPVSTRTVIEEAKARVAVVDLADRLGAGNGGWQKMGASRWARRCVFRDHEDRTPSFVVYLETNSFFCFGCLRGGDVIELARHAWEYERREVAMAAADLLREFGHELPQRPASWRRKQERQKPVRDAIAEAKIRHLQRRVFRIFMPMVEQIEDPAERREEIELLWDTSEKIAGAIWAGRRVS